MSPTAQFWLMTIVLALGTWLMRALPIMLHGHVAHPPWLERLLKHVPVAALTALVVPGALYLHQGDAYSFAPARTLAAVVALVVALAHQEHLRDAGRGDGGVVARPVGGRASLAPIARRSRRRCPRP